MPDKLFLVSVIFRIFREKIVNIVNKMQFIHEKYKNIRKFAVEINEYL